MYIAQLLHGGLFKGIVQWIFLSAYVVVLLSKNTLLFTRSKTKQYIPRYRQKSAPTLENTFLRFYSSLRKHPLAASPSDVTTLASMRKSGKGSGVVSPNGAKVNTNCDVTGGKIMIPACCFPSYCDFLDEPFFQNSQNSCMVLQISQEILVRFCSGKKESIT